MTAIRRKRELGFTSESWELPSAKKRTRGRRMWLLAQRPTALPWEPHPACG